MCCVSVHPSVYLGRSWPRLVKFVEKKKGTMYYVWNCTIYTQYITCDTIYYCCLSRLSVAVPCLRFCFVFLHWKLFWNYAIHWWSAFQKKRPKTLKDYIDTVVDILPQGLNLRYPGEHWLKQTEKPRMVNCIKRFFFSTFLGHLKMGKTVLFWGK